MATCLNVDGLNVRGLYDLWQTLASASALFEPKLAELAHAVLPAVETEVGARFEPSELSQTFRLLFVLLPV